MKLDGNTLIPIGSIILFFAAAMWISEIKVSAETNRERVERLATNQKEVLNIIRSIDQRLSRIEGKLGIDVKGD